MPEPTIPVTFSLAEIRNGTGWAPGQRFAAVPATVTAPVTLTPQDEARELIESVIADGYEAGGSMDWQRTQDALHRAWKALGGTGDLDEIAEQIVDDRREDAEAQDRYERIRETGSATGEIEPVRGRCDYCGVDAVLHTGPDPLDVLICEECLPNAEAIAERARNKPA